ncbi:putative acyl-activating enzyme 19 [Clonorchis sinensis]|uniref:Acyl-activating enzyme 19 n=1 Tax=Clonorchis sinensis TaxID=79923 RepID=A0A419Q9Z7_CLOSI|nr:putative acyl-activating enzyme 19 [Clonorchis sinensis]
MDYSLENEEQNSARTAFILRKSTVETFIAMEARRCAVPMKKQNRPLLYQLFEALISRRHEELSNKTAIWHVPDPRQLERAAEARINGEESVQTEGNLLVHSITFERLISEASNLANRISYELQNQGSLPKLDNDGGEALNSNELWNDETLQENTVVAIFMPPGIDRIVTQIACMKIRLAYLPLDRQLSSGRIQQILELIRPVMIITAKEYQTTLRTLINEPLLKSCASPVGSLHRLAFQGSLIRNYSDLQNNSASERHNSLDYDNTCEFRANSGHVEQNPCLECFSCVKDPVIIVLFTSGSSTSGQKIVCLRNQQLLNRFQWLWSSNAQQDENRDWCIGAMQISSSLEVHLASTACVFVDAFTELFGALFAGIPVVVPGGPDCASEVCVSDLRILVRLIRQFRITRLTTVPMQLKVWIQQGRLIPEMEYNDCSSTLNTVVVSGDILHPQLAEEFFPSEYPHRVRLINFYGTTEVAGDVTAAVFCNRNEVRMATQQLDFAKREGLVRENLSFVAVGKPISNTAVYIVQKCEDCLEDCGKRGRGCTNGVEADKLTVTHAIQNCATNNLSVIGDELYPVDWKHLGYELCEKGRVGEVAVTGLPTSGVVEPANKRIEVTSCKTTNGETTHLSHNPHVKQAPVNFPGDLGFICPRNNLLYICGRSDELVKINAVGFLASDVDRLLLRLKGKGLHSVQQYMSSLESKLCGFHESVTLPIRHPVHKSSQLVCFYAVQSIAAKDSEEKVSSPVSMNTVLGDAVRCATQTMIIKRGSTLWNELSPKPCELSTLIANYVPVYIRPVFVPVTHIPIMPTSGKVDKQLLRALYEEPFASESGMNQGFQPDPLNEIPYPIPQNENGINRERKHREVARAALRKVLGLQRGSSSGETPRPRDDEDFYLLGGNSLVAVLALESLRQLGFTVRLETFYQTSNIGQILDSLVHSESTVTPTKYGSEPGRIHDGSTKNGKLIEAEEQFADRFGNETIDLVDWNSGRGNLTCEQDPKYEEIQKLLIDIFEEKDVLTHAFGLTRTDLKNAVSTYLRHNNCGIVLLAFCPWSDIHPFSITEDSKLVGVLLAIPSAQVPDLPEKWPRLSLLQRYFDFCCTPVDATLMNDAPLRKAALTVIMVGVLLSTSDEFSHHDFSVRARWNRVMLEILARLERQLVRVAKAKGYKMIETLNTYDITREVCMDLGYKLMNTTRMQSFALKENIEVDPKYHDHHSYYMVKYLTD